MNSTSLRALAWVSALLVLVLSVAPNAAWALDCRGINTVANSAILANNTAAGGHVAKHVIGQPHPPGPPATLNTTAFQNGGDYAQAWAAYAGLALAQGQAGYPDCVQGAAPYMQIPLATLGIANLNLQQCTNIANGACTAWGAAAAANSVQFGFVNNGGNWILNTAFPRP